MPIRTLSSRAAGIALVPLILAACSGSTATSPRPAQPPSPNVSSTSVAPTRAATPTVAVPTVSTGAGTPAAPGSAAPTNAAAIPDGLYVSSPMNVADMRASVLADSKLSAAQKNQIIDEDFALDDHTTTLAYIDFHAGQYTEYDSADGSPREVGARGTYAFPDDHTLVIQEPNHLTTFQVTPLGTGFKLSVIPESTSPYSELDVIEYRLLFESTPFTPVPETPAASTTALIPDGLYVTPSLPVADAVASINADSNLSASDKTDLIENGFEFTPQQQTFVVTLRFLAGKLDQGLAIDGGDIHIGDHATFAFTDPDKLVIQDTSGAVTTFAVTWSGSTFTLKVLPPLTGSNADAIAAHILYESAPFGLKP